MYRIPSQEQDIDQIERMNAEWRDLFSGAYNGLRKASSGVAELARSTGRKTIEMIRNSRAGTKVIMGIGAAAVVMSLQSCSAGESPHVIAPTFCEVVMVQSGNTPQGVAKNFRDVYGLSASQFNFADIGSDIHGLLKDENGYVQPGATAAICEKDDGKFTVMLPDQIPAGTEIKDDIYG